MSLSRAYCTMFQSTDESGLKNIMENNTATPKVTDKAVLAYREEADYIKSLTATDAKALAASSHPGIREAAGTIACMSERHANEEYNHVKDAQDVETVLFYTDASQIRRALKAVR
jgi:hypothetical protein